MMVRRMSTYMASVPVYSGVILTLIVGSSLSVANELPSSHIPVAHAVRTCNSQPSTFEVNWPLQAPITTYTMGPGHKRMLVNILVSQKALVHFRQPPLGPCSAMGLLPHNWHPPPTEAGFQNLEDALMNGQTDSFVNSFFLHLG